MIWRTCGGRPSLGSVPTTRAACVSAGVVQSTSKPRSRVCASTSREPAGQRVIGGRPAVDPGLLLLGGVPGGEGDAERWRVGDAVAGRRLLPCQSSPRTR